MRPIEYFCHGVSAQNWNILYHPKELKKIHNMGRKNMGVNNSFISDKNFKTSHQNLKFK
jgi:hypothetical protein